MLRFAPTDSGGMMAEGDGPHGRFRVEWAKDGALIEHDIEIRTPRPPMPIPEGADHASATPCTHRGDVIDAVQCPTCRGKVTVRVFACTVHGRCTVAKRTPRAACCKGCVDYAP